ncbi:MAG TPA: hypothetical protein DCG50_11495 [Elusimicrobia bacterium]|nr:hypothetical protein [Elusimicrobiota bacterium]
MNNEKIAIIGLGIIAPKAMNKDEFWKNVLEGRNCVSEVPADRWDWKLYYSEDHKTQDKTYSKIGGFIEGFKFDSIKYKIPPQTASQISRLQQMTIEAARMALEDSGYDKKPFDPKKAAAVIGNAMGAMRKEFTDLRVYKFYNEDLLKKTATFAALDGKKREAIISEYEAGIDRDILKITEDTMPGELSNVTAGRIANVFNLNGPNMTMDAACASSLAALDYCVLGLRAGKFDMAVAGGADEMMSPPAYVKFCKIGALSADGSWTFDERANGFVMAEAVSIYILKRLSDAVRDGDKIYALINSVGASSDGKGKGITAPNPKGQRIAIENAFSQVDYSPADVDMVEAHGTATKVGDAAEVQVLKEVFGPHMDGSRKIGLTSIKSQIGHTKAAAGAVGIAKTALALYNKILPPSINCVKPNPGIDLNLFRVITKKEEWKKQGTRRANVSSFGFGGANFHVTMEEYTGPGHQLYIKAGGEKESSAVEIRENPKIPFSHLQGEAAIFTAPTQKGVIDQAKEFAASVVSKWHETYPLVQFTHTLAEKPREKWGVSIVAKSPADLKEKIAFLEKSAKEETWTAPPLNLKLKGVYTFKTGKNAAKTGFLFPGQGSQYVDMMRDLAGKYKIVQDTFDEADAILEKMIDTRLTEVLWSKPEESKEELEKREASIKQTQLTQPAMMTADIAMFRLLGQFGIKPDMAIGHSLGEYAAATAAGIFTFENGLRAVTSRAKEMSKVKVKDPGKMASVAWPHNKVEAELKKIKGYVICANKNCPLQTVIAGEKKAVEQAIELFTSLGVQAQEIAVSHAFHSSIIEPAMGPYRQFLESIPISPSAIPILSNVTADYFPADRQGVYDMLIKQMVSPVEFIKQLERMYSDGVRTFIECGPKRVLSAFAASTFKNKSDITILSSNHPKRGGITEFNDLLANMTALGIPVKWGGKLPVKGGNFFNPYYQNWAIAADAADTRGESQVTSHRSQASDSSAFTPQSSSFNQARFEALGINLNDIAFSGIAAGTPGTWDNLFREHNLDEILEGRNMIEPIPADWRAKQIGKNIIRVVKSPDGNHRIEKIDSVDQAIKLSARKGVFDLEKEFGVPKNIANAMDNTFRMALGAGVLALKDAGLPLIHYYKKTTTGSWLPEKWALPEPLASETGVIFASAFPVMESLIKEISAYFMDKYAGKSPAEMWEVYDSIISRLSGKEDKQALRQWMEQNFKPHHTGEKKDSYTFSQNFLLKAIPIGDSQFAQWVGAKGPSTHISAACASTTQAVHIAESWIRAGKAKRVVVVAADDITNETVNEWTLPGFLASGTATTKENISEAALPFDKRRHGLIVGSAAVALVIEDETLVRARGMKPLARLLLSDSANSAFHVTRLDTGHVASVMEKFVAKIERLYGLDRNHLAAKTLFMSHETYTPARGGSASAEVQALKKAFGSAADKVVVSNVKGFTGHTMGASLEDAVAIRALNTGIVPPIANYKEPDPELAGINLSKGGKYDLEYALRFAAGFGSHMAMSFMQRTYKVGEARIENNNLYQRWLSEISSDTSPELEVVLNTLRVKDKKGAAQKAPQPAISHKPEAISQTEAGNHKGTPKEAYGLKPTAYGNFSEDAVRDEILSMITGKTGYPKDMLELDLDMEADLGIDTVKQAELFAAIREHYSIPRRDNVALKDYPTIRHCIRFVLDETGHKSQVTSHKPETTAKKPVTGDLQPVTAVAPSASAAFSEDAVQAEILSMISEKTGYPKDILELDLNMEADLGIDTVKQAELFAAIREHYSIPRRDNVALKDYPTIRHCIRFVLDETGHKSQVTSHKPETTAKKPVTGDLQPVTAVAPSASAAFSEDSVQAEILSMISEKTGYPKDILELDLNMEADLGIDTVKQAELFAAIREHYSIPRRDNVALQDYPTIRHCIRFVLDETGAVPAISHKPEAISKPEPKQVSASGPSDLSPQPSAYSPGIQTLERPHTKTSVKKAALQPDLLDVTSNAPKEEKPAYPKRHIRYVPVIAPAPIGQEIIKKLSPKRPVVVFGEDLDLLKAFRAELNKHRVDSFIFTSAKTKMKDSITVDFKDLTALDKTTADFAAAHPDVQGVFYLMGCMVKSLSDDTAAFTDLKHYALGLFAAGKHFNKALNNTTEGHPTFMAVVSTLDGGFGYKAKDAYDPVYGAIYGITMCLRKELEKTLVKMIDFEPSASNQAIVQKTFYELLYSDKRLAVAYQDGKRFTMLARPETLDTVQARTPLEGKTVLITGGGRGLGALFAKILAERFKPNLILLDIITLDENSAKWAAMSGEELAAYKTKGLWQELKKKMDKPTPAILEKEFTRIKDSALLYKSITELKAAGSKVTYCKCDLNDSDAFDAVMEKIKADFGRIDGVVHFAGLERSKMVADKTFEEFLMIFNTKAASAINLWKAGIVKDAGFWVMISSVAGKFGNLGQSDYAAASDYIAKFANSLSNKGSRGLSVDMTAYANVGMAMRPGVEAFLKSQEMEFLYPEEGMNAVADELVYGRAPEIVLSGSLGKLDWDKQLEFAPDFPRGGNSGLHFVENIRSCAKGSSLAATTKFSLERDPYLADHSINGTPYVPGVMGLETFAEAASAVSGAAPQALKNVHFTVPIKLLREKPVEIIIKAGAAGTGFEFKIESDFVNARGIKMGNTRTHFTAEAGARSKSSWEKLEKPELPKARKYAVTGETIYKTYFHGPSFQVLAGLLSIQKESVLAVYKRPEAPLWKTAHPKLIFHPMVIESLFQACGYRDVHFERKITLPDAVEEVTVYDNNPHDPAELYLYGLYKGADEDGKTLYDAYAFDADFNLFAEIKNYRMIATQI